MIVPSCIGGVSIATPIHSVLTPEEHGLMAAIVVISYNNLLRLNDLFLSNTVPKCCTPGTT